MTAARKSRTGVSAGDAFQSVVLDALHVYEAAILRQRTDELVLRWHAEGRSLRVIAAALNDAGDRPPTGTRWHPETVRRIVAGR